MSTSTKPRPRLTRADRKTLGSMPGVKIESGTEVEIFVANETGEYADVDATETVLTSVQSLLGWSGFRTGYGSWMLRAGYVVDTADYCDPSARCHY